MKLWAVVFLAALLEVSVGQNESTTDAPTTTTTTTTASTTKPPLSSTNPPVTTTISPEEECMQSNKSCDECLKHAHCLWCNADNSCKQYPVGHVLPKESDCPLEKARWGVCWVNFKILIIVMSCIGGAIILTISCCCVYCCCCRGGGKKKLIQDEAKYERQKDERKRKSEERRTERKAKTDEIRRKYGIEFKGLVKDNPYSRFDADA